MYIGIDVSEFQGNIDFKKVKNSGCDFVIVRSGYDEYYVDPYFEQNVNNAKSNGLHVGVYWFMYFTNEKEAEEHADIFIKLLEKFKGKIDYPVALDVEEDTYRYMKQMGVNPTPKTITNLVKIFCKRVEKAGYYVMIYSNLNGFNNYMNDVSEFDTWLAQYDGKKPYRTCGIWQHTSTGSVNGVNGDVDMNVSYVDYPTLLRNTNLNHLNVVKPPTSTIKVGDTVAVTNAIVYGTNKKFVCWHKTYEVIEVAGDRIVIGKNGIVTAPISINNVVKVK